jgi:hypothetical protein
MRDAFSAYPWTCPRFQDPLSRFQLTMATSGASAAPDVELDVWSLVVEGEKKGSDAHDTKRRSQTQRIEDGSDSDS